MLFAYQTETPLIGTEADIYFWMVLDRCIMHPTIGNEDVIVDAIIQRKITILEAHSQLMEIRHPVCWEHCDDIFHYQGCFILGERNITTNYKTRHDELRKMAQSMVIIPEAKKQKSMCDCLLKCFACREKSLTNPRIKAWLAVNQKLTDALNQWDKEFLNEETLIFTQTQLLRFYPLVLVEMIQSFLILV